MVNALSLDKDIAREVAVEPKQTGNIFQNISEAFSNAVKKGVDSLSFPEQLGESVKKGLEKIDLKEIGSAAAESALKKGMSKLGMKSTTFNGLKGVAEAIKEGDLKKGLESGLNAAISLLKVPQAAKTMIKGGKDLILNQFFEDELKTVMKKQKNTISRIDKKCKQMEEAFQTSDTKTLDRVAKTLKSDLEKVMPIRDVIHKGEAVLNQYQLYKTKGNQSLTATEKELCQTLSASA